MDRAVVIALAALAVVLVGVIGAGLGFLYFSSSPVSEVRREYQAGELGSPGVYSNFRVITSTPDYIEFEFDIGDGQHCKGSRRVARVGPMMRAGSGVVSCSGGPWQHNFPPGQVNCDSRTARAIGPMLTASGFTIQIQNTGSVPCHVSGPMQVLFFSGPVGSSRPLNVDLRGGADQPADVVLQPGQTAVAAYDVAGGPRCYSASGMSVLAAGPPLVAGPVRVCGQVTAHPPVLAS